MSSLPPFQRVLEEHREGVWRFLVAVAGPDAAEDCFQETFLAALRAYPRLADGRNLRGWIYTIAQRKAVDAHRRRRGRATPVDRLPERAVAPEPDDDPDLWHAVAGLPPKQRAAVAHRFISDLTYKDIATAMSCSEDAARRSVHEGIKRLREVLR